MVKTEEMCLQNNSLKKVLVVDDEPDIVFYLATVLKNNGYEAFQALNADEVREKIRTINPDLICLDIMMPKRSGIALYQELKVNEWSKEIPVIFISAYSIAQDFLEHRFRKLIPDRTIPAPEAYIEKPVEVPTLLAIIRKIIG